MHWNESQRSGFCMTKNAVTTGGYWTIFSTIGFNVLNSVPKLQKAWSQAKASKSTSQSDER
jgi:hypothetical protein